MLNEFNLSPPPGLATDDFLKKVNPVEVMKIDYFKADGFNSTNYGGQVSTSSRNLALGSINNGI